MELNVNGESNKLVVFDMDDTLLKGRFIDTCAEQFKFKQALSLLRQIDHDPVSLTKRIAQFLKGKTKQELLDVADSIDLVEDIRHVVLELKKRGYKIGIISDSYQLITEHVAKQIGAEFSMGNELQYDGEVLTGEVLIPSWFHYSEESTCKHQVCKTNALRYAARKHKCSFQNCIAVGDSDADVCMIRHAGLGVAFCTTSDLVREVASKHIETKFFRELLQFAS